MSPPNKRLTRRPGVAPIVRTAGLALALTTATACGSSEPQCPPNCPPMADPGDTQGGELQRAPMPPPPMAPPPPEPPMAPPPPEDEEVVDPNDGTPEPPMVEVDEVE